jgi:hypothetical protein
MPQRVALLVLPDFQLLDVGGRIAAFELAGVAWQSRPLPPVSDLDTHVVPRAPRSATGTLLAPRP